MYEIYVQKYFILYPRIYMDTYIYSYSYLYLTLYQVNEIIVNKINYFQDIYKIIEKTCFLFENLSGYIINRNTDVSENCNMDVSEKHRFDLFLLDFYKLFLDCPLRGALYI
jgi:hypothetical protein